MRYLSITILMMASLAANSQNCKTETNTDLRTGTTTISTRNVAGSSFKPRILPVATSMVINKRDTAFMFACSMPINSIQTGEGVVFLLANGYQYEYPASKVYTDTNGKKAKNSQFSLVGTVLLRRQDMPDFAKYAILKMKIMGMQSDVGDVERKKIQENINCLLSL